MQRAVAVRVTAEPSTGAASQFGSVTVIPVRVTLPVLVTVNVYGTDLPGRA